MIIMSRDARAIFHHASRNKKNFSKKIRLPKKKQFAKPAKLFLH